MRSMQQSVTWHQTYGGTFMKKIEVVTYCTWTSIGSVLQSLGLKKALLDMGCQSRIWLLTHRMYGSYKLIYNLRNRISSYMKK